VFRFPLFFDTYNLLFHQLAQSQRSKQPVVRRNAAVKREFNTASLDAAIKSEAPAVSFSSNFGLDTQIDPSSPAVGENNLKRKAPFATPMNVSDKSVRLESDSAAPMASAYAGRKDAGALKHTFNEHLQIRSTANIPRSQHPSGARCEINRDPFATCETDGNVKQRSVL
jgi:hypothetical protein